jgi:nucleoside-diphosphate-sugar epimerase
VLVTGGAGAIGGRLTARLAELAREVIVLDDLSSGFVWNVPQRSNVRWIRGSVLEPDALAAALAPRPAIVFHLAAFFANQNSVEHPERDLMVNGLGTLRVLEAAARHDVRRLVYAASSSSYGGAAPLPIREDHVTTRLATPYQITKLLGEMYVSFFERHHELPAVSVRLFNSYGPGELPGVYRNVVPNFVFWAMRGLPLPVHGDGTDTRDFTYVDDLVDGLLRAGTSPEAVGREINLASGTEVTVLELAQRVLRLTGGRGGIEHLPHRKWDGDRRRRGCIEAARRWLGYEPAVSFDAGLTRTVRWFRDNWDLIRANADFDREIEVGRVAQGHTHALHGTTPRAARLSHRLGDA